MTVDNDVIPLRALPQPQGIVIGPDLLRVTDEALAILAVDGNLFRYGSQLVEIVRDEPTTRGVNRVAPVARIHRCDEHRIHELLSKVQWLAPDGRGGMRVAKPPIDVARKILSRGTWRGIREITHVATAATLRPDGTLLFEQGFDTESGIFLLGGPEISVPSAPTREDAVAAAQKLLDLLCDFPATAAGKAAWLGTLISVVVRPAVDGPIPLLAVGATTAGVGKGLATDAIALIATDGPAPKAVYSGEDGETRKLLTSVLLVGDPLLVFDNVQVPLGDQALDKALTDLVHTDRLLGQSKRVNIPMKLVLMATGNGLEIKSDMRRRAILMQLDAREEFPEERTGWKYPRLLEHVRTNRAALLSAALTIPLAFIAAGRPDQQLRAMGSYEAFTALVRAALVWCGLPDPCATVTDIRAADMRTDSLRAMMAAWPSADGEVVTAAELLERATSGSAWRVALTDWCPPKPGAELPNGRALGNALRGIRRRIVVGKLVDSPGRSALGVQWMRLDASVHVVHLPPTPAHEGEEIGDGYVADTQESQIHDSSPGGGDDAS